MQNLAKKRSTAKGEQSENKTSGKMFLMIKNKAKGKTPVFSQIALVKG